MIIGAIIVGILIFALIVLVLYISDRCGDSFDTGVFMGIVITILSIIEICFNGLIPMGLAIDATGLNIY